MRSIYAPPATRLSDTVTRLVALHETFIVPNRTLYATHFEGGGGGIMLFVACVTCRDFLWPHVSTDVTDAKLLNLSRCEPNELC